MRLPALRRRRHSPRVKAFVRKIEVTFILAAQERRNRFQETWLGKGNNELYNVRKVESELQCHFASLPNDREGTSVIALDCPAMCSVVSGDAFVTCRRSDSARMSCIAASELRTANRWTQWTLGLLSLYSATCLSCRSPATASMTNNNRRRAANSKSEFVMVPLVFCQLPGDQ